MWQQYFKLVQIEENKKDIFIEEYKETAQKIHYEEKSFYNFLVFLLISYSTYIFFIFKESENIIKSLNIECNVFYILFLISTIIFSHGIVNILSTKNNDVVYSLRKMIMLRSALGVDYANVSFVIPQRMIQGAVNPFVIKPYPGLLSNVGLPICLLCIVMYIITYSSMKNIFIYNSSLIYFIIYDIGFKVSINFLEYFIFYSSCFNSFFLLYRFYKKHLFKILDFIFLL